MLQWSSIAHLSKFSTSPAPGTIKSELNFSSSRNRFMDITRRQWMNSFIEISTHEIVQKFNRLEGKKPMQAISDKMQVHKNLTIVADNCNIF